MPLVPVALIDAALLINQTWLEQDGYYWLWLRLPAHFKTTTSTIGANFTTNKKSKKHEKKEYLYLLRIHLKYKNSHVFYI